MHEDVGPLERHALEEERARSALLHSVIDLLLEDFELAEMRPNVQAMRMLARAASPRRIPLEPLRLVAAPEAAPTKPAAASPDEVRKQRDADRKRRAREHGKNASSNGASADTGTDARPTSADKGPASADASADKAPMSADKAPDPGRTSADKLPDASRAAAVLDLRSPSEISAATSLPAFSAESNSQSATLSVTPRAHAGEAPDASECPPDVRGRVHPTVRGRVHSDASDAADDRDAFDALGGDIDAPHSSPPKVAPPAASPARPVTPVDPSKVAEAAARRAGAEGGATSDRRVWKIVDLCALAQIDVYRVPPSWHPDAVKEAGTRGTRFAVYHAFRAVDVLLSIGDTPIETNPYEKTAIVVAAWRLFLADARKVDAAKPPTAKDFRKGAQEWIRRAVDHRRWERSQKAPLASQDAPAEGGKVPTAADAAAVLRELGAKRPTFDDKGKAS